MASAAAKNLIPCILELGGKSPLIVDKSANLEYAAMKAALGAFINFGQTCIRPDYCLVEYTVIHKFVEELKKNLKDYDKDILGHSISGFHYERVCQLLADH